MNAAALGTAHRRHRAHKHTDLQLTILQLPFLVYFFVFNLLFASLLGLPLGFDLG